MRTDDWSKDSLLPSQDAPTHGEQFVQLLAHRGVVVEQILSSATPGQEEYDQAHDEWVLLLDGAATLQIGTETVDMVAGDHLWLPAHTPHRVQSTDPGTRWLAVHIHAGA